MLGMVLNMAHYVCSSCDAKHDLFGPSTSVELAAQQMGLPILCKLPLVSQLSWSADRGVPLTLTEKHDAEKDAGVSAIVDAMDGLAKIVMTRIES